MLRSLALAAACLAASTPALAQSIRVRTIEAQTGRPVSGAIVVLLDSTGRRIVQGLTDDLGRISFPVPAPGVYRLKADRIGHPGTLSPYFAGDISEPITLEMPAERFELPELAVTGTSVCGRRESDETARLWEEIRKALSANEITASAEAVELLVRRFVRYRSRSGSLRSDSTTGTFTTRESPFVAVDPALLIEGGYIQSENGQYVFLGPDATQLLSDGFLETHCFRLVRADRDMPGLIGLGFEPVKGRDVPEIKGTLWVDRATAELRTLAYEYVNVPRAVRADGLGGRLEFERLPGGSWIIRDWYIRMPDRVDLQRRPAARRQVAAQADTIVGFIDNGGSARPLGDASGLLNETAVRTSQASVTVRDVRISVMSSGGTPIEGALIAVAELDTTLTTGAGGHARMTDVAANRLRLRLRAIGHSPLSAVIALESDRRQVDTTLTMTATVQRLDSIVVTEKKDLFMLGKMGGFERRRKEGFGVFLDSVDLANPLLNTLDQQFRRFGRLRVVYCMRIYVAAALSAGEPANDRAPCGVELCLMSVYLDGALYYTPSMGGLFDLRAVPLHTMQGIEVYRGPAEMPVEYNATGSSCGVILLWTR